MHLNRVLTNQCELILVDDGSKASLQDVCDSVAKDYDSRLIFTHDERPWTQPKGRNLGASVARGDKLLFDDVDFNSRYARLCQLGIAKPDEVKGEGYAYPEPASDQKRLFHWLSRH